MRGLKSAEELLTEMKERCEKFMKAFLQNSIPTFLTAFEDGRFVEVSEVFLKLMGLKRNEVIGNTSTGIGFLAEAQQSILFRELYQYGRVENLELQVKTKGGKPRNNLFNAVMMTLDVELG